MAASPDSFKKSHVQNFGFPRKEQSSKSCSTNLLCKFLIMALALVLVPLFPSQAPNFVNDTVFKEFWELFHLLVIGIAVSYGLFCRKSAAVEMENRSSEDASQAYLSGFLNVPSFFEDGFEKLSVSDEKMDLRNWDSFYSGSGRKPFVGNGNKDANEVGKENNSQIWNSQYLQGQTLMVVADENFPLDEHKPLGLPVRSLRSRVADNEKSEFTSDSGYNNYGLKGSSSSVNKGKVEQISGPVPLNLEKKFEEVTGPLSLQPKLERTEMREGISNLGQSCHCRPHSDGNFEMQHFRSRSSRNPRKSFGGASSLLPELSNPKKENFEVKKGLNGFSDTVSQETVASENVVGVSSVPKAKGFSIGLPNELDMQRPSKDYFNDSKLSAMQHVLDREKKRSDSVISGAKTSKLAMVLARGRSVRTIRSRVFASDEAKGEENYSNQTYEKVDENRDQFEAPVVLAKKVKGGGESENHKSSVVKATSPVLSRNNEIANLVDNALFSEKGSESDSESEGPQWSADEKEKTEPKQAEDAELEGSEVDRKADEFIAKFREQMRLQKIASVKRQNFRT